MKPFRMRVLAGVLIAAAPAALAIPSFAAMMAPPTISIASPAMGASVSGADIPVTVSVQNFNLECANAGKTNAPVGEGHIHAMIDGMAMAQLTTVACGDHFAISGRGLKPGKHMLTVVLATDAHAISSLPASTSFMYERAAVKALPSAMSGGKPSVELLSPKSGADVGKRFNLVVAVNHFDLSCELEGKPDVAGWGHLHVMVQQEGETSARPAAPLVAMMKTPEGMKMGQMLMQQTGMTKDQLDPMLSMAMPSMIGMPCTKTIPVDLSTWHSGPARIIVQLASNDHMPTMGASPAVLNVTIK